MPKIIIFLAFMALVNFACADSNKAEFKGIPQGANLALPTEDPQAKADQLREYDEINNRIIGLEKYAQQTKEEIDKKFDYQIRCNETAGSVTCLL